MTSLAAAGAALLLVVAATAAWTVRSDGSDAGGPTAERGEQVFLASGCALCHDAPGHQTDLVSGPDLTDLANRATAAYVRQSIVDPDAVVVDTGGFGGPAVEGSPMPALGLDDAEIDAIAAYLLADAPQ